MCQKAVDHVIDNRLFDQFAIGPEYVDFLTHSWEHDEQTIYGRFDFSYNGTGPPKLLEYNADTPTALLEAAVIQWFWLQDTHPEADQFNSLHEKLIDAWKFLKPALAGPVHFSAVADSVEDQITVHYLRDTAHQAGLATIFLPVDRIGWDRAKELFVDENGRPIRHLFKLYPWEWLMREKFGPMILQSDLTWIE